VKIRNFRLSVSPGNAEALVRWGGKMSTLWLLTFLATFVPKTIKVC